MNIKTWIAGLQQATMAANAFKNITVSYNGTGLNAILDDISISRYSAAIKGLTIEQAKLALSTTDLSAREKELILTKAGLMTSLDNLTAKEALSLFQQELGNKADAKSILIGSQLLTEKELEENATIKLTWAQIQEAVSKGNLSVENAKLLTSSLAVQGANYGESISFDILTKSIWGSIKAIGTFLVTNPVGWAILAAGAIAGTVAIVDALTVSLDEAKENLSNLKSECESIESDLSSMNNELQTTVDRINELKQKDSLTFAEKEEYDNLVATNQELQRKIDLLELEQKIKNQEKNKAFVQAMEIDASDNKYYKHKSGTINNNPTDKGATEVVTEMEYANQQVKQRKFFADSLEKFNADLAKAKTDDEKKRIQSSIDWTEKQLETLDKYILDKNKEWTENSADINYIPNPSTDDDRAVNEWLDYVYDFQDRVAIAMGGTNAKTNAFNRIVNNWKFDSIVQGLQDLGKEGKVTAEMLNDPKYDEFIQKLVEIGVIDSADNLELIALAFNTMSGSVEDSADSTDTLTTSITSLNDAFTKLKELLEDIVGYADTYQSAMQKIASGTGLTADEVSKILEIDPTLVDKIVRQEDGKFTIDLGELWASYELKVVGDGKEAIAKEKKNWQNEYDNAIAELNKLQAERAEKSGNAKNNYYEAKLFGDLDKQINEAKAKIKNAKNNLNLVSFKESLLNYSDTDLARDSFELVKKEIDGYNDSIIDLNKAIDTLNEGNSLSYSDMTSLVGLYPQLKDKVVKTADGYTIEKSALEEVRKQSYKTRNGFIDDQIAETQTAIDETKKRIELYKHEIALISSAYAYQKAIDSGLFENLKSAEQTVNAMQDLIDTLLGYKNEVLDPDNGNTTSTKANELSDQLQQQIDYYKMLLEAVEIVTDRVIDNLEKEKDALKEKNDEQQRELDLLEAKNNLEKAKKQKVFVYKEGQGLVQVQDEKAVKDAQKEYDDIQNEIKEAEIDKQIDKWEEYKKQFSEMENNIQDALTVEQAKKALGTDEQGLLSLDDKTIAGIRDGLAEATYKKDVEDNKDNPKYQVVSFDDFLKSVGATVSPKDFQAMVSSTNTNKPIFNPNLGNILNNMQTVNNKTTNNVIKAVFNIYDATDPQNMVKHIDKYMRNLFTQTLNSVK